MLQQAAMDAVRTWRYRPYLLNGEPVEVETPGERGLQPGWFTFAFPIDLSVGYTRKESPASIMRNLK